MFLGSVSIDIFLQHLSTLIKTNKQANQTFYFSAFHITLLLIAYSFLVILVLIDIYFFVVLFSSEMHILFSMKYDDTETSQSILLYQV